MRRFWLKRFAAPSTSNATTGTTGMEVVMVGIWTLPNRKHCARSQAMPSTACPLRVCIRQELLLTQAARSPVAPGATQRWFCSRILGGIGWLRTLADSEQMALQHQSGYQILKPIAGSLLLAHLW